MESNQCPNLQKYILMHPFDAVNASEWSDTCVRETHSVDQSLFGKQIGCTAAAAAPAAADAAAAAAAVAAVATTAAGATLDASAACLCTMWLWAMTQLCNTLLRRICHQELRFSSQQMQQMAQRIAVANHRWCICCSTARVASTLQRRLTQVQICAIRYANVEPRPALQQPDRCCGCAGRLPLQQQTPAK